MAEQETIQITLDEGTVLLIAEILREERGQVKRDYYAAEAAALNALKHLSEPTMTQEKTMAEQVALIEIPVYETTGSMAGPHVLHDLCRFEILGTLCQVRTTGDGDALDLTVGQRRFAVSLLDLAATAALSVEAHLRGEIQARILSSRPKVDPDGALAEHHFGSIGKAH